MSTLDKRALSERDICTKYITPALRSAGWDEMTQIREEVGFSKGRIIVRGKLVSRGKPKSVFQNRLVRGCRASGRTSVVPLRQHVHRSTNAV